MQVNDHHGVPLAQQNVLLWQSGAGSISAIQLVTDSLGRGEVQLTAPTSVGNAWILASTETIKSQPLGVQYTEDGTAPSLGLTIVKTILSGAFQGVEYQAILKATGGTAPYVWSVQGLPKGLNLDATSGVINGIPSDAGYTTVEISVTDALGTKAQTELLFTCWKESSTQLTARALVRLGENTIDNGVGLFIGLTTIQDSQGNGYPDHKIAGYKLEVDYDPENVEILDVVDGANLGQFTINLRQPGKLIITDAGFSNVNSIDKLVFIPFALTGSAKSSTNITVRFLDLGDQDLNQINPPIATIVPLQRGKIINLLDETGPKVVDAIAGLQYLAGLRKAGQSDGEVNTINMASILPPLAGSKSIQPSVKNVIALIQYLVGLRDDRFQPVIQPQQ